MSARSHTDLKINCLRSNDEKLLELSFVGTTLDNPTNAESFGTALKDNDHLIKLDLRYSLQGCSDRVRALVIKNALATHPSIKVLSLSNNTLTDYDAVCIAQAMKRNRSLKELRLSFNQIGDRGAKALAEYLLHIQKRGNNALEALYLSDNKIGPHGAKWIAKAIDRKGGNSSLKKLHVCENNLSDEGVIAIARALQTNKSLLVLELDCNDISDKGTKALASALHHKNTSLLRLCLAGNKAISDASATSLETGLKVSNNTLEELDLSRRTKVSKKQRTRIDKLCKTNWYSKRVFEHLDTIPIGAWSRVLGVVAAKPDLLYTVLTRKPDLIPDGSVGSDEFDEFQPDVIFVQRPSPPIEIIDDPADAMYGDCGCAILDFLKTCF